MTQVARLNLGDLDLRLSNAAPWRAPVRRTDPALARRLPELTPGALSQDSQPFRDALRELP